MSLHILVINSGSSSLKFSLFDMTLKSELISGLAEKLGTDKAQISLKHSQKTTTMPLHGKTREDIIRDIINHLNGEGFVTKPPAAIGHRVVHGGETFQQPTLITPHVINKIEQCSALAPLHNPANLAGIKALQALYPDTPQVAVFDTAFHQTIAPKAFLYGLPYELYETHKIRRYGFHGISHQYVATETSKRLNLNGRYQLISAHLGNGCSATATIDGRSVDTTMGMTPLEGLVMGTRSGNVDPGLHLFLAQTKGWDSATVTQLLNQKSGLLGISGLSNDMRDIEIAAKQGHARACLAIDIFAFTLAKHIGALATSLIKLDALVFTGGIGENSSHIREKVIENLSIFGFNLDTELNATHGNEIGLISDKTSPKVLIVKTQEELVIATETYKQTQLIQG